MAEIGGDGGGLLVEQVGGDLAAAVLVNLFRREELRAWRGEFRYLF